jgi:hypothetical protein
VDTGDELYDWSHIILTPEKMGQIFLLLKTKEIINGDLEVFEHRQRLC